MVAPIKLPDAFRWWSGVRLEPDRPTKQQAAEYLDQAISADVRREFERLYRASSPPSEAIAIRMTDSGQWTNVAGGRLKLFTLELINGSQVVDRLTAFSGAVGAQTIVHPSQDRAGSYRPIPEGVYTIGPVERAPGFTWGSGLGKYWVDLIIKPQFKANNRSAFGFHVDGNYSHSPGSAGCVVLLPAPFQTLLKWLEAKARPTELIVDYGLGFLKQRGYSANFAQAPEPTTRKINAAGLNLIKEFEGLYLTAYLCPSGIWTIGWGHTANVRPGMKITRAEAEQLLQCDVASFEACVNRLVNVPLTDNQFSALVSFAFNCGCGALENSTLLRLLNQKNYQGAADQFLRWVNGSNGPLAGLVRRREQERSLFLRK